MDLPVSMLFCIAVVIRTMKAVLVVQIEIQVYNIHTYLCRNSDTFNPVTYTIGNSFYN